MKPSFSKKIHGIILIIIGIFLLFLGIILSFNIGGFLLMVVAYCLVSLGARIYGKAIKK